MVFSGKPYVKNKELYKEASKYIEKGQIYKKNLTHAIEIAKEKYTNRVIFIVGSFYVYKKVCEVLNND